MQGGVSQSKVPREINLVGNFATVVSPEIQGSMKLLAGSLCGNSSNCERAKELKN